MRNVIVYSGLLMVEHIPEESGFCAVICLKLVTVLII